MKPGLVRRMAMTSSAMGTVSSRSSRAVYLPTTPDSSRHDDLVGNICQGMHPGLARLMAMTSSAMGTVSSRSSRAVYLPWLCQTAQETSTLLKVDVKVWSSRQRWRCRSRRFSKALCLPAMPKSSKAR